MTNIAKTLSSLISPKLLQRHLSRDHIVRCSTPQLRLSLAQATQTIEDGRRKHAIHDPRIAALYGKVILGSALLSSFLKGEERVILHLVAAAAAANPTSSSSSSSSRCPVSRLYGESLSLGEVRGYVHLCDEIIEEEENSAKSMKLEVADTPTKRLSSFHDWNGRLPPNSSLSLTQILYEKAVPVQSIVPIASGDIETDLREYFLRSEQNIPTALRLEVKVDPVTAQIVYAGGILAQRVAQEGGKQPHFDAIHTSLSSSSSSSSSPFVSSMILPFDENEKQQIVATDNKQIAFTPFETLAKALSRGSDNSIQDAIVSSSSSSLSNLSRGWLEEKHSSGIALSAYAVELVPELEGAFLSAINDSIASSGDAYHKYHQQHHSLHTSFSSAAASPSFFASNHTQISKFSPFVHMSRAPLDFFCRCSKDKFLQSLSRMGEALLDELEHAKKESASDDGNSSGSSSSSAVTTNNNSGSRKESIVVLDTLHSTQSQNQQKTSQAEVLTTLTCQFCNTSYPIDKYDIQKAKAIGYDRQQQQASSHLSPQSK